MSNHSANTTSPGNPPYLWEGEPKKRGTYGIITFCFSTLIICIWSTLHFNVPIRRCTATRRFSHQVSWMFIALLAPELLLYFAINEMITARILLKQVLKFHPHLAKPGMLVGMNNWIRGRAEPIDGHYDLVEQTPRLQFSLVHSFYAIMGGFAFYGSYDDDNHSVKDSLFQTSTNPRHIVEVPKFDTLIYIMKHFPHIITDITEAYIFDRSASSGLSKALLIVQVAWFCTSCASRLFEGLPLSLLEVSTTAHAFCTLVTYFVWWSKPINVATPTILRKKEAQEVYALLKCSNEEYDKALELAQKRAGGDSSTPMGPHGSEKLVLAAGALQHLLPTPERPPRSLEFNNRERSLFPGAYKSKSSRDNIHFFVVVSISPILYGLVHFLAWNEHFPTPLESRLWHISSFVVTCSGLGEIFACIIYGVLERFSNPTIHRFVGAACILLLPILHVLASAFLIGESFRQLFFLDPAAYQLPSWSQYWPRLS